MCEGATLGLARASSQKHAGVCGPAGEEMERAVTIEVRMDKAGRKVVKE
jgi:hypothetical protein